MYKVVDVDTPAAQRRLPARGEAPNVYGNAGLRVEDMGRKLIHRRVQVARARAPDGARASASGAIFVTHANHIYRRAPE